jgi:PEP-CTERM motif
MAGFFVRGRMGGMVTYYQSFLTRIAVKLLRNGVAICALISCDLHAQTVVVDSNLEIQDAVIQFGFPLPTNTPFSLLVWQNAARTDPTGVYFKFDGTNVSASSLAAIINGSGQVIDTGSNWYVVHAGDIFSRSEINTGKFSPLVEFGPTFYPSVNVGTEFYVGVSTGQGFDGPQDRTVYGWAHLRQQDGFMTMIENVMSYDSPGIIVGTTTLVPEPGTIALVGLGIVMLATQRPRR